MEPKITEKMESAALEGEQNVSAPTNSFGRRFSVQQQGDPFKNTQVDLVQQFKDGKA
ncbi:MAG: hypothetical protein LBJ94_03645 [Puniceicoccales bacterium]|jgi:hypothetical protein|nr:hypothetical protein [Puniceicoccales bacterium]